MYSIGARKRKTDWRPDANAKPITFITPDRPIVTNCKCVDYRYSGLVNNGGIPFFADARVQLIGGIGQGTGPNEHVGNEVELVQVLWDCQVYPNFGVINPEADTFKLAFVYDRQPNGTLPDFDDIFQSLGADGSTDALPSSNYNINNVARFIILRDMRWTLSPVMDEGLGLGIFPTTTMVYGTTNRGNMISDKCALDGLKVVFSGTGYDLSDISTGALYMVNMGYYAVDMAWRFDIECRVYYRDSS